MVKNPNWQEADQRAICKRGRGVELGATEKQLQLAVRPGLETGTSGFQVRRPNPLDHAASHCLGDFCQTAVAQSTINEVMSYECPLM